jgi:hypothetical protein
VILGRRAQHGRAADINVLDGVLKGDVRLGHRGFKRIEIHAHQVDRRQPVLLHDRLVLGVAPQVEQSRVHLWVQGLDPAVQHLREAGEFGNVFHLQPGRLQRLRRAAGGEQFHPEPRQPASKLHQPRLVRNTQ